VKPLDGVKVGLLLLSLGVWFVGYRTDSPKAMYAAIGIMVVAFLLRFVKPKPPAGTLT
jgi:hypothetical protein